MPITAKILADSVGPAGVRLTTFLLRYPRFIHSELLTHRAFSRNAASSRAIPPAKMRANVLADPAVPVYFGANQKGMQATREVADVEAARRWWLEGLEFMERHHARGEALGIHKQIVNRPIEPWMYIEVVMTSDEYGLAQMFHQRRHPDAQPEFQALAEAVWLVYSASIPTILQEGDWHLPFVVGRDEAELRALFADPTTRMGKTLDGALVAVSTARSARVSYFTHEGVRDPSADLELYDRLVTQQPGHWSPLEHAAKALATAERHGNLTGWLQARKHHEGEFLTSYEGA